MFDRNGKVASKNDGTTKDKKKQKKNKKKKTTEIEPNMEVIEKWLDAYHFNEEQKNMCDIAKKNFDDWGVRMKGRNTQQNPLSTQEEEERKKMYDYYRKYCSTKSDNYESWIVPNNLKSIKMFHIEKYKSPDTVSQFMIDYIEATHNLFKIQQKQINELQSIVLKLNAKKDMK